jgi:hypothetical protein
MQYSTTRVYHYADLAAPQELQLQLGSLIRSGDLLAVIELAVEGTAPSNEPFAASTVLVMMRIDHVQDIVFQTFQQVIAASIVRTYTHVYSVRNRLNRLDDYGFMA